MSRASRGGELHGGYITQTDLDVTGQRRDGTGLLSYNARSYDPALGKFISPDTIVPGAAGGAGGAAATLGYDEGVALGPLTVGFQEPGFAAGVGDENRLTAAKGFWFQRDGRDRGKAGWGPANPQALNRYAYVLNNPVRYTDPTGHGPAEEAAQWALKGLLAAGGIAVGPEVIVGAVVAAGVGVIVGCAASEWCRDVALDALQAHPSADPSMLGMRLGLAIGYAWAARGRYLNDPRTAGQIISDEKRGKINREFPDEWRDKTCREIDRAAQRGDRSARTARKLLTDGDYDKDS